MSGVKMASKKMKWRNERRKPMAKTKKVSGENGVMANGINGVMAMTAAASA